MKIINLNPHSTYVDQTGDYPQGLRKVLAFEVIDVDGRDADLALGNPGFKLEDDLTDEERTNVENYCVDYELAYGHRPGETAGAAVAAGSGDDADSPESYEDLSAAKLKVLVKQREVDVKGTGKKGSIVKADLVAALEAHDAANASPEPADDGGGTITTSDVPTKGD